MLSFRYNAQQSLIYILRLWASLYSIKVFYDLFEAEIGEFLCGFIQLGVMSNRLTTQCSCHVDPIRNILMSKLYDWKDY